MNILIDNMQWVLLACGVLTTTMIQAVFFPNSTMRAYFGEPAATPAAEMLMRNWGALVTIAGVGKAAELVNQAGTGHPAIGGHPVAQRGGGRAGICGIVRNIGREGQEVTVLTLGELRKMRLDMFCTVFIGNSQTRNIHGKLVTPRGYHL